MPKPATADEPTPEEEPVDDGSGLTPEEQAKALKTAEFIQNELQKRTNPATRPTFGAPVEPEDKSGDFEHIFKAGYLPTDTSADETAEDRRTRLAPNLNKFPRGDIDNFRVTRLAMAMERSMRTTEGDLAWRKWAPWESAYVNALKNTPSYDPVTKAQGDMVSGQDGGFLAPEIWSSQFIDQIYAAQVLNGLPITRLNMGSRVEHLPRLNSNISISYSGENASIPTAQAQFQQVTFTARKQATLVQISNELIRDSNPTAEDILRNNASRWMALDRDKQILVGDGLANRPTGLLNATNVATGTIASAGAPTFGEFITGIYNVENLNGSTNVPVGQTTCTGIVGMVALKQQIMSMKDTTNNRPIWDFGINQLRGAFPNTGGGQFSGLFGVENWAFTNIIGDAANSRHIFFGDWQHLCVMQRQDVEIVASNVAGTAFQNDQTWIRLISRYDVGVFHPEAFYIVTNG